MTAAMIRVVLLFSTSFSFLFGRLAFDTVAGVRNRFEPRLADLLAAGMAITVRPVLDPFERHVDMVVDLLIP